MQFTLNEPDPICSSNPASLFLVSGNERNSWKLNAKGRYGFYASADARWVTAPALVNESDEPKDLQVSVSYEWIFASSEEGKKYRNAELLWVNLGYPCGDGMSPLGPSEVGEQKYTSGVLIAPLGGPVIVAESHLHDGGVNSTLFINGKVACTVPRNRNMSLCLDILTPMVLCTRLVQRDVRISA
jgi:hypothetical protein